MVLARRVSGRSPNGGASGTLVNQASMLVVVALCVTAIILSGAHLGRHFGLLSAGFLQRISVPLVGGGGPSSADTAIRLEAGLKQVDQPDALPVLDSPAPTPSPTDVLTTTLSPSPTIMTRAALHAGAWVPVLMYHYVRTSPDHAGIPLSVLPSDFAAQMHYLNDHGFNTVSVHDLDLALLGKLALPPKPVALTFDDGYQDFYSTAVPIMRPLGITATNYVPTMLVGRSNYMTWSEIQLLDSEGYEMAAHSQFHVDVSKVSHTRAQVEIFGAKSDLENRLGHAVFDWAYPYGGFNYSTVQLVHDAGYLSGASTKPGAWHDAVQMPLLTRVRVGGGETLTDFARSLGAN